MIGRLLLAGLLFALHGFGQPKGELVPWQQARRLTWEDFKGTPPAAATNAALTSSSILINFSYNRESLRYDITCNFDRNRSWGRIKNDHILAHEQGHFDITEIHARRLYKSLQEYRFRAATVSKDVNDMYQQVIGDLQQMQHQYDAETDHSRNFPAQKIWLEKIDSLLTAYQSFADYAR